MPPSDEAVVRLWRIQDEPSVWTEAPADRRGYGGAVRVTTPPHGAEEFVALKTPAYARLVREAEASKAEVERFKALLRALVDHSRDDPFCDFCDESCAWEQATTALSRAPGAA